MVTARGRMHNTCGCHSADWLERPGGEDTHSGGADTHTGDPQLRYSCCREDFDNIDSRIKYSCNN